MQAWQAIAHLAFNFRSRGQGGNGVDDDDIHRARAHQGVGDFQSLLTRIGLRHQKLIEIDAKLVGIAGIEGVLGIDKGGRATHLLDFCDHVQGQRRLTGTFRTEDFDHPAARQAANA